MRAQAAMLGPYCHVLPSKMLENTAKHFGLTHSRSSTLKTVKVSKNTGKYPRKEVNAGLCSIESEEHDCVLLIVYQYRGRDRMRFIVYISLMSVENFMGEFTLIMCLEDLKARGLRRGYQEVEVTQELYDFFRSLTRCAGSVLIGTDRDHMRQVSW